MFNADTIGNLAKPGAFGMGTIFTATLGLAEVSPQIATLGLAIPNQRIDPLVTNPYPRQRRHKTANLLWALFFSKSVNHDID